MRQFIRHPVDVPIEVRCDSAAEASAVHTHDISAGGLAFRSGNAVEPGRRIEVRIPHVQPPFEATARVVWCRPGSYGGFELGVAFLDAEDAFLARMVEQVCYIEDYRRFVLMHEGRDLTQDEAAAEWITKYAARFPDIGVG
jgi:hypothetical protein